MKHFLQFLIFLLTIFCVPAGTAFGIAIGDWQTDQFVAKALEKNLFSAEEELQLIKFGNFYTEIFMEAELTPARKELILLLAKNGGDLPKKAFYEISRRPEWTAAELRALNAAKNETYFEFCLTQDVAKVPRLNDNDLVAAIRWLTANHVILPREKVLAIYTREQQNVRDELLKNYAFLWENLSDEEYDNLGACFVLENHKNGKKLWEIFENFPYPEHACVDIFLRDDLPDIFYEEILEETLKKLAGTPDPLTGTPFCNARQVVIFALKNKYFSDKWARKMLEIGVPAEALVDLLGNEKISKETRKIVIEKLQLAGTENLFIGAFPLNFSDDEQRELLQSPVGERILALASDANPEILARTLEHFSAMQYELLQNPNLTPAMKALLRGADWDSQKLSAMARDVKNQSDLAKEILLKNACEIGQDLLSCVKDWSFEEQAILFELDGVPYAGTSKWSLLEQNSPNPELFEKLKAEFFEKLAGTNPDFCLRSRKVR